MLLAAESWTAYFQHHMTAVVVIGLLVFWGLCDAYEGRNRCRCKHDD
jgi:hypothetical protein